MSKPKLTCVLLTAPLNTSTDNTPSLAIYEVSYKAKKENRSSLKITDRAIFASPQLETASRSRRRFSL